ncbi:BZ3500_MvSof-1268-A1-R1_Chr6-3g08651 [Microbotryum saponariae]|uniref:BZ3500_MvSof-1268-A1-R1_Chr6-3g08651 protein n=1 Tax=Microbotryum saponariae TaxID=289078 RepID=A0A2X0MM82_9BASI|nr:BZ3500_MvSof-1268-A1-R1_Chr6-3g08651 [Microbotryum saponariae]
MQSSFKALLAQATKDTTKSQLELSQTLQKRQLAAEEAERTNLQKERQRQAEIERRRRERFEREKEEEERRRLRPLPKTRNLTELKMERRKRGLNEDGRDDRILNTLEAAPDRPTSKAKIPGQSLKQLMAVASQIPPSAMRTNPKPSSSSSSSIKPVPTNEQKLAKKRDALFREEEDEGLGSGSMALARQRGVYEERERARESSPRASTSTLASGSGSGSSSKPISAKQTIRADTGSHGSAKTLPRPTNGTLLSSAHGRTFKKGSKNVPGFDPSQFVKLNTEKRDTRTIEEIERDMRVRKLAKGVGIGGDKGISSDDIGNVEVKATTGGTKRKIEGGHLRTSSSSNAAKNSKASTSTSTSHKSKSSRRRSETPSDSESDSNSSQDARHRQRPSKLSSSKPKKSGLDDSVRSEIWRLMGRDRSKDLARPFDLSDSEEEGMEVDGEELEREERRAERISRLEEREEEERERRRKEEKERRRKRG